MWEDRPIGDLIGRILYHRNHIRYWEGKEGPLSQREVDCLKDWRKSYFDLMQAIMKRGGKDPYAVGRQDEPFR